jgi:diadenosine tetraphosphatase ApaH/serine/threonine PP2A family protein phosphatase
MRYLVLTDVHANLEALDTCVADARDRSFDKTLLLGDIVGYGPDPNEVVDRVKHLDAAAAVRGNHDKVACGIEQADGFNLVARSAAVWTLEALTAEHRSWLAALPAGPIRVDSVIEICHGSPFDEDAYIFDELDAIRALKASDRQVCLYGHTHQPMTFEQSAKNGMSVLDDGPSPGYVELPLRDGFKYLLNPGSVGQPRDGDPRAAYAIVDTERRRVELVRVTYPVALTQSKIVKAGLPDILAQRLAVGR